MNNRKHWEYSEVLELHDAVKKYKLKHGAGHIKWNVLREDSNLTRFSPIEVRQKYANELKKSKEKLIVSDPSSQPATRVDFTESGIEGSNSEVRQIGSQSGRGHSDEIKRIAEAASKVRPRTAFGYEFRKFLGYFGGPDRTHKNFLDRLTEAVKDGMLGHDWYAQLLIDAETICDWGREERRDIAKLKHDEKDAVMEEAVTDEAVTDEAVAEEAVAEEAVAEEAVTEEAVTDEAVTDEVVTEEAVAEEAVTDEAVTDEAVTDEAVTVEAVRVEAVMEESVMEEAVTKESAIEEVVMEEKLPFKNSEQSHRQLTTESTQGYENEHLPLNKKRNFNADGIQQRISAGLSTAMVTTKSVSVVSKCKRLPVDEEHTLPPKKRNMGNSLYNNPIFLPYGVLLPNPTGYGTNHTLREFTDNEWRRIIVEIKKSHFDLLSDAFCWEILSKRAGVISSVGGLKIQLNFCKHVIPRFVELMRGIVDDGELELDQDITEPSRLTDIAIYHSLKNLNVKQIMPTLEMLSNLKFISVQKTSFNDWYIKFINSVVEQNNEYFKCNEEDLQKLKNSAYQMTLNCCKEAVVRMSEN